MSLAEAVPATIPLKKKYCGWVPTISGRLSFSVFGNAHRPTRTVRANVADDEARFLAVYQLRNTSDALILSQSKLAPYFYGTDGRFVFAFIACTDDPTDDSQDSLKGRAFIFRNNKHWKNALLPGIARYQNYLRKFDYINNGNLKLYASSEHAAMLEFCTNNCVFFSDVCVRRSGTTEIQVPFPLVLPDPAPKLPTEEAKFNHVAHFLACQVFYFVKDLGHRHQHHDPATDQIVSLSTVDGKDDHSWRVKTLYNIYRRIIEIKREPHAATFADSLGLIAYAEAFSAISKSEVEETEGEGFTIPTYYSNYTVDSIMSTKSRVERIYALKQRSSDLVRTTVLSIAALLLSFIGLLRLADINLKVTPHVSIVRAAEWALTYPIVIIIFICFILIGVKAAQHCIRANTPNWMVSVIRFFQSCSWKLIVTLLSILVLGAGYLFVQLVSLY